MSTHRGIFDNFPTQPASPQDSPFAIAPESDEPSPPISPFTVAARLESPFSVFEAPAAVPQGESGHGVRLPERRKPEAALYPGDADEGFGFEAQAQVYHAAAFSFLGAQPQSMGASPFAVEGQMPQPMQAFNGGSASPPQQDYARAGYAPAAQVVGTSPGYPGMAAQSYPTAPEALQVPTLFASPGPVDAPAALAPAPTCCVAAPSPAQDSQSDSFSVRQLELRAIFGTDREMNEEEILKRSRALPGIRNLARVDAHDMAAVESLKHMMTHLGFGGGELKLYFGSTPLDFIREGSVILAVQTEGGFGPGVREILMLVARELGRMSH